MLQQNLPTKLLGKPIESGFRKWLRIGRIWQTDELTGQEKVKITLLNVFGEIPGNQEGALSSVIDFYLCGDEPAAHPPRERMLDWEVDGACIWADFRIYAGINLHTAKLHWWEFMALFGSLPAESGIRRRMELRGIDLGKIKDPETREEYRRAKEAVALTSQDDGWDDIYRNM